MELYAKQSCSLIKSTLLHNQLFSKIQWLLKEEHHAILEVFFLPGKECHKLKWHIVLYADAGKNAGGTYKVYGTAYRKQEPKTGNWKIITGKNERVIYQLY